jgi:hypothetical protein
MGGLRSSGTISLFGNEEDDIISQPKQPSTTSTIINNTVYIKDVSYLMPLDMDLAKEYT